MGEIHTPKSRPPRCCRDCGSEKIAIAQLMARQYLCAGCHAERAKKNYHRRSTRPKRVKPALNVKATLLKAIEVYQYPMTINELSEQTGVPKPVCTGLVCKFIQAGVLRRTGAAIVYGPRGGGMSKAFELASLADQRQQAHKRRNEDYAKYDPLDDGGDERIGRKSLHDGKHDQPHHNGHDQRNESGNERVHAAQT